MDRKHAKSTDLPGIDGPRNSTLLVLLQDRHILLSKRLHTDAVTGFSPPEFCSQRFSHAPNTPNPTMAGASRTYRTALEISIISIVIHILLGTPGLELFTRDTSSSLPRSPAKVDNLVYPRKDLHCPRHSYTTHIFATSPLVIYIDNFLSDEEADHLVALR
jgi:prolyl 4-hydroxylase